MIHTEMKTLLLSSFMLATALSVWAQKNDAAQEKHTPFYTTGQSDIGMNKAIH